jgi:hypothetical protein
MDIDGNEIARFRSASEAARVMGVNFTHISNCASGYSRLACGYRWRYENEQPID